MRGVLFLLLILPGTLFAQSGAPPRYTYEYVPSQKVFTAVPTAQTINNLRNIQNTNVPVQVLGKRTLPISPKLVARSLIGGPLGAGIMASQLIVNLATKEGYQVEDGQFVTHTDLPSPEFIPNDPAWYQNLPERAEAPPNSLYRWGNGNVGQLAGQNLAFMNIYDRGPHCVQSGWDGWSSQQTVCLRNLGPYNLLSQADIIPDRQSFPLVDPQSPMSDSLAEGINKEYARLRSGSATSELSPIDDPVHQISQDLDAYYNSLKDALLANDPALVTQPQDTILSGNPQQSINLEFPEFCGWASIVCDFIDWFRADVPPPDDPEFELGDIDPYLQLPGDIPNPDSSCACPEPYTVNMLGTQFAIPLDTVCSFADVVRPMLLLIFYFSVAVAVIRMR